MSYSHDNLIMSTGFASFPNCVFVQNERDRINEILTALPFTFVT